MLKILDKIWLGWKKIARTIGRINSHILLTVFYFLIIGPVCLIKKSIEFFSGKNNKNSYWVYRTLTKKEADFEKQF